MDYSVALKKLNEFLGRIDSCIYLCRPKNRAAPVAIIKNDNETP